MKKSLIGLMVSGLLLGSAVPAMAGTSYQNGISDSDLRKDESIWEIIDDPYMGCTGIQVCGAVLIGEGILADLILIAGMATMLDTCGNGKPFYTLFAPIEYPTLEPPGPAAASDQVNAAVGGVPMPLEQYLDEVLGASVADLQSTPDVVRALLSDHLVNGSFSPWQLDLDEVTTLTARSGFTLRNENGMYINDLPVIYSEQACNGWIYFIDGVLDSTPQVPTEGLNALDTPQDGTPGGSNSLPNTL